MVLIEHLCLELSVLVFASENRCPLIGNEASILRGEKMWLWFGF